MFFDHPFHIIILQNYINYLSRINLTKDSRNTFYKHSNLLHLQIFPNQLLYFYRWDSPATRSLRSLNRQGKEERP